MLTSLWRKNRSDYIQTHCRETKFDSDSWVILNDIEQSIKTKIEKLGRPIKDWNVEIFRGILTGFNDAFIISTDIRNEILNRCQTEEEKTRTEDIIRPILRGRDIKRYNYDWEDKWLIWIPWHFPMHFDSSIQGASIEAENSFLSLYPSVYQHLVKYKEPLSKRNVAETGIRYEWYALQRWGANYWDEFSKPKIVWIELSDESKFALCGDYIPLNTVFFLTGNNLEHILGLLNSKLIHWYFTHCLGARSGVGTNRWLKYTVEMIPLIPYSNDNLTQLVKARTQIEDSITDNEIDKEVYELYHLNEDEIEYINSAI